MKLLLLALPLISRVTSQLIDPTLDVICPDNNPTHCYPKIFIPTDEWQHIRDQQEIPPGLHVRLNIETGEREARLMEAEDDDASLPVVVESNVDETMDLSDDTEQKIKDSIKKFKAEKAEFERSKAGESDLHDFSSCVDELLQFEDGMDIYRLEKALDTLIELSHDLDFGERLTLNPHIFAALLRAAEVAKDEPSISEKCLRIMGSSLRNNPKAIKNVLEKQDDRFVDRLFEILERPGTPDVVQKRVLGVIHALTSNTAYAYQEFNADDHTKSSGLKRLLRVFPSVGPSSRERIAMILEDLNLLPIDETDNDISTPEARVSFMIQDLVAKTEIEEQLRDLFEALVNLHTRHDLRVTKDFLLWLSKESESRKLKEAARDDDAGFRDSLLHARHAVFGNPNAGRKADEF